MYVLCVWPCGLPLHVPVNYMYRYMYMYIYLHVNEQVYKINKSVYLAKALVGDYGVRVNTI